jgi:hypothetical protein
MGRRDPMLDPRLFARRGFAAGSLSAHAAVLRPFGLLFIGLQYLQLVLGYSPIEAGASILPMALMLVLIAPRGAADRGPPGRAGGRRRRPGRDRRRVPDLRLARARVELPALRPGRARDRHRDRARDGARDDGDRFVPPGRAAGDRLGRERPHPRGRRRVRHRGARERAQQRLPRPRRACRGAPAGPGRRGRAELRRGRGSGGRTRGRPRPGARRPPTGPS